MTKLADILDTTALNHHVYEGNIRTQVHPDFPELMILNYTEQCTWNKAWDDITLACRGFIFNTVTGEVVARPFSKFFNHDQEGAPALTLDTPVVVTEKMDGSMGILYQTPDGEWAIATRGSFASDQALWATKFYNDNYADMWEPVDGFTYIFEIIYPENRIVVDYGDKQGLVLLGKVNKRTGRTRVLRRHETLCPTEVVETHEFKTYGEVIASDQRSNKEGFVLWNPEADWRVKIKHEEYVILHRFMTNTSPKNIWEVLSAGQDPAETFALAPDEFHEWMKGVIEDLVTKYNALSEDAHRKYESIIESFGYDYWTRAEFAKLAAKEPNSALLFKILDERPIEETLWKMIKPRGDEKMVMKPVDQDSN